MSLLGQQVALAAGAGRAKRLLAWQYDFTAKARGETVEPYLGGMKGRIPLGRTGATKETAAVAAILCSAKESYITAEAIHVSGGEECH